MKNKKGFTLIELIGVIVLISLIFLLTYSFITNTINSKKNEISDAMNKIIYDATDIYIGYNLNKYPKIDTNVYCIKLQSLVDIEILSSPLMDPVTNKEISLNNYVKVEVDINKYNYQVVQECIEKK